MGYTISKIAEALSARVEGDETIQLSRPATPLAATSDELALAMDPQYADDLVAGDARAAILWDGADWRGLGLEAAIFVERPRYAMSHVTTLFEHPIHAPAGVHPSAIVDPSATLGEGVSIGPFCVIGAGAVIGERSRILSHSSIQSDTVIGAEALIYEGVRVGARVKIGDGFIAQPNAVIGADGFSYVTPQPGAIDEVRTAGQVSGGHEAQEFTRINSLGSVRLGNKVEIGAGSVIDRGTIADTVIGNGTKLDNLVQVGHNVVVGETCLLCGQVGIGGSSVIGDRVVLGGQVGVADHVTIGDNVIAAGKSGISSNVPPNRAIMGNPAILMEANVQSYKAYRRLPRLSKKLDELEKQVSKLMPKR